VQGAVFIVKRLIVEKIIQLVVSTIEAGNQVFCRQNEELALFR
jgi:hypothetical protein